MFVYLWFVVSSVSLSIVSDGTILGLKLGWNGLIYEIFKGTDGIKSIQLSNLHIWARGARKFFYSFLELFDLKIY